MTYGGQNVTFLDFFTFRCLTGRLQGGWEDARTQKEPEENSQEKIREDEGAADHSGGGPPGSLNPPPGFRGGPPGPWAGAGGRAEAGGRRFFLF